MDAEALLQMLDDLRDEFMRDVIRAVRNQNRLEAMMSVAGIDAVERIARRARLSGVESIELKKPISRMR